MLPLDHVQSKICALFAVSVGFKLLGAKGFVKSLPPGSHKKPRPESSLVSYCCYVLWHSEDRNISTL